MSNTSIVKSPKYLTKCGMTKSTATYATIGPYESHVTIRSAGSNSQTSSGGYGAVLADADEIKFIQVTKTF